LDLRTLWLASPWPCEYLAPCGALLCCKVLDICKVKGFFRV
jgi:hypothetical protein